jgi:transposase
MVVVSESQHKHSLNFANQRKVVILRDARGQSSEKIAQQVVNLEGEHPSAWLVADVCAKFNRRTGHVKYKYERCGRKAWKVTPAVRKYVLKQLVKLRPDHIVTATTLQRELVRDMDVELEASTVRRILEDAGYRWMARSQKPKFSDEVMLARLRFARLVLSLSRKSLRERLSMAMDGVFMGAQGRCPSRVRIARRA